MAQRVTGVVGGRSHPMLLEGRAAREARRGRAFRITEGEISDRVTTVYVDP